MRVIEVLETQLHCRFGVRLSKSSKKVSWAPDANLCQAKLFQSNDCPSHVHFKVHDDLLEKESWIFHSDGLVTACLPHGLKVGTCLNQMKKENFHILKIRWKCPPKFVLSSNWLAASGEESQEAETQKLREKQVVEAVYSLTSAIPPSPSVSLEIEECHQDDFEIPLVPITPMEDEETVDTLSDLAAPISTTLIAKPPALSQDILASGNLHTSQYNDPLLEPASIEKPILGTSLGIEADVIAAVTAAVIRILKCKGQGHLIDTDLLIKILANPKFTEKLINDRITTEAVDTIPMPESIPVTPSVPLSCKPANGYTCHQPKKVQRSLASRSLQEDTFPVSWPNQVAHRVPLPQANGNMPSLPSDGKSPLNPVSCVNLVALPKPESNMYPSPNETLPDSNLRLPISDTVRVALSSASSPSKGSDKFLLSEPAGVNISSAQKHVQRALNRRCSQMGSVQLSRSEATRNRHSLVDEVLTTLDSKLPEPNTGPISVTKPIHRQVPIIPIIDVDMVATHKVANESHCPLRSVPRSTVNQVRARGPVVSLPGSNRAPDRVLSPRRDLNNILERVQPTPDTTILPSVLPTTSCFTVKSVVKDANYYKSLVKQHGGEKQGTQDQITPPYGKLRGMELKHKLKLTELKTKFQKSCIFYNSPTGCRNGSNCSYQHDTSSQLPKRMKLDPGRN